jgi:DNA-binding NtrC family response regulator
MADAPSTVPVAPVFIIADDDREAIEGIVRRLNYEWYYIPVWETRLVVRYAGHFQTTAVFLSDGVRYPEGGAARLLQMLLDRVAVPVVILAEVWSPDTVERWKKMGAADCIPHPTRVERRIEGLRAKMEEFALSRPQNSGIGRQENRQ